jgi:hypothetical protein
LSSSVLLISVADSIPSFGAGDAISTFAFAVLHDGSDVAASLRLPVS